MNLIDDIEDFDLIDDENEPHFVPLSPEHSVEEHESSQTPDADLQEPVNPNGPQLVRKYTAYHESKTFQDALDFCKANDGSLAAMHNDADK